MTAVGAEIVRPDDDVENTTVVPATGPVRGSTTETTRGSAKVVAEVSEPGGNVGSTPTPTSGVPLELTSVAPTGCANGVETSAD